MGLQHPSTAMTTTPVVLQYTGTAGHGTLTANLLLLAVLLTSARALGITTITTSVFSVPVSLFLQVSLYLSVLLSLTLYVCTVSASVAVCLSVCLSLSVCLEGVGWGEWTEINSPNNSNPETSEPHIPELDDPVTEQELRQAMKHGNASGIDEICGEFLKYADNVVVVFLMQLFNRLYDASLFPSVWSKSVIVPIFQKGDDDNPDNYRGMSQNR